MSNYTKTTNFAAKDSLPSGNAAKIVKGAEIDTEFNNIATASATKANANNAALTGTTVFATLSDGTIAITGWVDEDNMASNSAVLIPTQQSVKAYVDSNVTAQDLDVTDGTTSIDIDLDSESLGILGGTGVTSTASGTGVTLAIDSTVATLTGTQTLTNKTLTTPTILTSFTIGSATITEAELEILDGATVTTAELNVLDGITSTTAELNILDGVTSTAAELNILDGVTSTAAEINILDGVTSTTAELNILDGVTSTASELNILDGVTSTTTELNILDGVTATTAEINYVDGVTSNVQTQLNTKAPIAGATFTGTTTIPTADINGGAIDGTVIGGSTAAAGSFTTLGASGAITGTLGTASQQNITLVGNLQQLNVAGDLSVVQSGGAITGFNIDVSAQRVSIWTSNPTVSLDMGGVTDGIRLPVGTTAQRPTGAAGMFRYNSSLEQFEGYTDAWGSIGGGGGTNTFTADSFTANGSTTAYALSQVITSEDNLLVFIDGVFQQQDAYSIATSSGTTTLTFSSAPANTRKILIYSIAAAVSGSNLNIDSMTGDGSDTTLSLSITPINENNTQVFIDGVYQNKSTYSISGTTLTFSTAPPSGTAVEVMTFTQTDINVPVDGTVTPAKIASGDFYFDTNTLYVDATNNRVGIGTSSPSRALATKSSSVTVANFESTGSTAGLVSFSDSNTTNDVTVRVGAVGNNLVLQAGGSERLRIDSSGDLNIVNTGQASLNYTTDGSLDYARITGGKSGSGVGDLRFFTYSGGIAEAFRITGARDMYFGQTSGSAADVGHIMQENGVMFHTADATTGMYLRRLNSDGDIIQFNRDSVTVGSIGTRIGNGITINTGSGADGLLKNGGAESYGWNAGYFYPRVDNSKDLGLSVLRWDDIFATNGTIQTSDRNEKQDIAELSDAEQRVAVATKGLMRKFRWKDSVAEKGDNARIHFGIIAQDLQAAFEAEGLDAARYAMFTSNTWWETQTEVAAVEAVEATEDTEAIEAVDAYTRTDTYDTAEEAPEGATERTRLGVRYSELLAFIIAAI